MAYGFKFDDLDDAEKGRTTANLSEQLARGRHEDYDEVVKPMYDRLQSDDELRQKIATSADAGESLYRAGIQHAADELNSESLEDIMAIHPDSFNQKDDSLV